MSDEKKPREKLAEALAGRKPDRSPYAPLLRHLNDWRDRYGEDESETPDDSAEEETEAAIKWLREKWGDDKPCPWCGNDSYYVSPPESFLAPTGRTVPYIAVICRNCGQATRVDLRIFDSEGRDSL
jgi:hypothetical protein